MMTVALWVLLDLSIHTHVRTIHFSVVSFTSSATMAQHCYYNSSYTWLHSIRSGQVRTTLAYGRLGSSPLSSRLSISSLSLYLVRRSWEVIKERNNEIELTSTLCRWSDWHDKRQKGKWLEKSLADKLSTSCWLHPTRHQPKYPF